MRSCFFAVICLLGFTQAHAAFNLTWGLPSVSLDQAPPIGDTDLNPQVAIDLFGNGVAVWSRTSGKGAGEDVWMASFNHATRSWSTPVQISGGGNATNPTVKMDEAGHTIFMWEEGFPTQIMTRTLSPKGVFSPPLSMQPLLLQGSPNAQIMPHIAVDQGGNALVVWMEFYKGNYHIHSAKKPLGQNWTTLGEISKGIRSAHLHFIPSLSINTAGDAVTVWQETNEKTGFSEVHGSIYLGGAWLPSFAISADAEQHSLFPSAGIDASSNVVFVWNQFGPMNTIKSKTYRNGILSDAITASNLGFIAQRPHVAVDAMGNAVVVYERFDTGPSSLATMNKFIASATLPYKALTWSTAVDVSGPSPNFQGGTAAGYPVLSLNSIGDGVVIWKEFNGSSMVVQSAGYSLGTWSLFRSLSSKNGSFKDAYDMAVSINLAGSVIALWPEDPTSTSTLQLKATTGVGLAAYSPQPPLKIPQSSEPQFTVPTVMIPPVTVPITHPTLSQPSLVAVAPTASVDKTVKVQSGTQVFHRFPGHGDLINILNWTAPSGEMVGYKIYRGNLYSLVAVCQTTQFEDHQRTPGVTETYLITAIDSDGHESSPVTIIVPPMK